MPSDWHSLGQRLVPRDNWDAVLEKPGMLDVQVRGVRPDDSAGSINVTVQPSVQVQPGLFVAVNDEFHLTSEGKAQSGAEAVTLLSEAWEKADERPKRSTIMS